jgi:hypothetical protein
MRVTLVNCGNRFGTADWDVLPVECKVILLRSSDGLKIEARSVDRIEDDPSGGKIVHFGGARPSFSYAR